MHIIYCSFKGTYKSITEHVELFKPMKKTAESAFSDVAHEFKEKYYFQNLIVMHYFWNLYTCLLEKKFLNKSLFI